MGGPLALCFGVHNHQPVGNFEHVLEEATAQAYRPFLERLSARPEIRVTAHWTGGLLEWLRERSSRTFDLLATLVGRGQVELLTGGFYEPILAIVPDRDKVGQIQHLTEFLRTHFGIRPRGMWLAERVWEPHLPGALRQAGVDYVLVDDSHFALAGFDIETLGGYYLTEDEGATVAVFPISQQLRYLIPFHDVEASAEYLERRRGQAASLTIVDDGEKFGVWPGTHALVYQQGWLDRFFDQLLALPWLRLATFAEIVDGQPASGRAYLPTASYREMTEWALPAAAARELAAAKREVGALPQGERIARLLRGGFWRNFLIKYPEVADTYWKMLRLSRAIHGAEARDAARLGRARRALWRGQANDAYWHGVFGGCYLPHLRRAVKQSLVEAERLLVEATGASAVAWTETDGNGDGQTEIFVRTPELTVTVNPEEGGMLTEVSHLARGLDLADVLARRPEIYHDELREPAETASAAPAAVRTIHAPPAAKEAGLQALLAYDEMRRGSLMDGLFPAAGQLDAVAPWGQARLVLGRVRLRPEVTRTAAGVAVALTLEQSDAGLERLEKQVLVEGGRIQARYRLRASPAAPPGQWAVQWNLALTAGGGGDRYLALPERPPLSSSGRRNDLSGLTLVDEWIGLEARLEWTPQAEIAWGPVETVSVSEGGFERIYQGTAYLVTWPLVAVSSPEWELVTSLTVTAR
ncbi:MAG TPA: alpha-amylase/4-alpha-glucanotransferase domain-containing protein [Methylomirabilota bacterium]